MKLKRNIIFGTLIGITLIVFTACNDGKKEEQMRLEKENMEMELAEKEKIALKEIEETNKRALEIENSIAGKAMATQNLSTLVTALNSANLATMLSEPGAYTVFAPSDQAFSKLPEGTLDHLLNPENKEQLQSVLKYHVVSGIMTSDKLAEAIKGGNGKYTFKTVSGEELTASMKGDQYVISDLRGKTAQVIKGNVEASNGIVYIIDNVLLAKK